MTFLPGQVSNTSGNGYFSPGVSGNPGGRPRGLSALQIEARRHAEDAIKRLAHLMHKGTPDAVQVAACREMLDRAYGKPQQTVDLDIAVANRINELNLEDLAALERKLVAATALPALTHEEEPEQPTLFGGLEETTGDPVPVAVDEGADLDLDVAADSAATSAGEGAATDDL
jgi:hypothetical protein